MTSEGKNKQKEGDSAPDWLGAREEREKGRGEKDIDYVTDESPSPTMPPKTMRHGTGKKKGEKGNALCPSGAVELGKGKKRLRAASRRRGKIRDCTAT